MYAKAYGNYFLLTDLAIKTFRLPSCPSLFYHMFDLMLFDPLLNMIILCPNNVHYLSL